MAKTLFFRFGTDTIILCIYCMIAKKYYFIRSFEASSWTVVAATFLSSNANKLSSYLPSIIQCLLTFHHNQLVLPNQITVFKKCSKSLIFRQPGQQFTYEDGQDNNQVDTQASRSSSRFISSNRNLENDHHSNSGFSPTRRYSEVEIQPKIGHYYSRSPSPPPPLQQRRPMTSRSASRNAMTQQQMDPRSPSPPRRPMTSRSASRNAMTQVEDDLSALHQPLSPTKSGM